MNFWVSTQLIKKRFHRVGQLSFNHFAANSVAEENRSNAGNTQLKPDQTDELTATVDWHFGQRGSFKVEAFHQWRSDILEQIIVATDELGNIEQGLGNAGDATLWGIKSNLKLPVDHLIPHGLIDFSYRVTRSKFDDPIINGNRGISNSTQANKTLHFFIETSRFMGVKMQLEVGNANTSQIEFKRRFYLHTRVGEYTGNEVAKRQSHPYFLLSVFGEF